MTQKLITRRAAASGLIMTGLSAPALILPDRAGAKIKDDGIPLITSVPLILLLAANRRFRPALFIIMLTTTVMLVHSLRGDVSRRDISQADGSKIPLIGNLFSKPVQDLIMVAQLVGLFYAINEYLIFRPSTQLRSGPETVSFVNDDNHFFTNFRGRRQDTPQSLAQYNFRQRDAIGRGYLNDDQLIGAFPPYGNFREPNA